MRWILILAVILFVCEEVVYRYFSLRRISYQRFFPQSVARAGETIEMVEVIENKKFLPVPRVLLEATFDASLDLPNSGDEFVRRSKKFLTSRSIFSLSPYTRITRKHQLKCEMRGIFQLNSAAMTAGGLFGTSAFKQWSFTGPDTELTVYPRILPDVDLFFSSNSFQGDTMARRFFLPDPFTRQGTRPYQTGDPLRQVNWKATARTGDLQVHLQEFTSDYYVKVLLNFVIDQDMWTHIHQPLRIECGISLAATIADQLIASGISVGFHSNGVQSNGETAGVPSESGYLHLEEIWTHLAGLDLKVRSGFRDLLLSEIELSARRTDFILITGYVDEGMELLIQELEDSGHSVSIVPLPSEAQAREWLDIPRMQQGEEGRTFGKHVS